MTGFTEGPWFWCDDSLMADRSADFHSTHVLHPRKDGTLHCSPEDRTVIQALPILVGALRLWNCTSCGGSGKFHFNKRGTAAIKRQEKRKRFTRALSPKYHPEEPVTCNRCGGHGFEPLARGALTAAGVITP